MTLSIGLVYRQKNPQRLFNLLCSYSFWLLFSWDKFSISSFRFAGLHFASRILAIQYVSSETKSSSSTWNASSCVHMIGFISIVTSFQVIVFELKLMSSPVHVVGLDLLLSRSYLGI